MPDLIAKVIQEVQHNVNGTIIGVQAGVVHGDVIDVKIYTFPVGADRRSLREKMQANRPRPFKFLEPYGPKDHEIFCGRSAAIDQVTRAILEHGERLVVIHGEADVGKTSLIAAGVIPKLMESGALILQVQDYVRPFEAVSKALRASAEEINVDLEGLKTIPELAGRIIASTGGTLFLIFDQFEQLFDPALNETQRMEFIDALAALRDTSNEFYKYLFVVILVRDEANGKLAGLRGKIPDLWKCQIPLSPLTQAEAIDAIKQPLRNVKYPVTPVDDVIENHIVPDLDELTADGPDRIHPPYLQIVCGWLYDEGRKRDPPLIDVALYRDKGDSADGILASHMSDTLRTRLSDFQREAEQLLLQMASPGVERWVSPDRLQLKGLAADAADGGVRMILEKLFEEQLLVRRKDDAGQYVYALAHPIIRERARLLGGAEGAKRLQAEDELERAWSVWLARKEFATANQLRYLAEFGTHLAPPAVQSLFLLRSAAERGEPARLWLKWLRDSDDGRALVAQLETREVPAKLNPVSPIVLARAGTLLGLAASEDEDGGESTFGAVTQNAVLHEDAAARQASALALTVLGAKGAISRLKDALEERLGGLRRKRRMAELRGALANADPEIEVMNVERLSWLDRLLVWRWRVMRRVGRDRARLLWLTAGGVVGAGLCVALFRALTLWVSGVETTTNSILAINLYAGATLGAALSFGVALADSLVNVGPRNTDALAGDSPPPRGAKSAAVAVALATAFYGVVHLLIGSVVAGPALARLPVVMGFVGGAGLGFGLYLQGREGSAGLPRVAAHLLVAAAVVAFTQFVIINYPRWSSPASSEEEVWAESTAMTWPASFYMERCGDNRDCAEDSALVDAGLAGLALAGGAALGMSRGRRWLAVSRRARSN